MSRTAASKVHQSDESDDQACDDPQPGSLPVDPAGSPTIKAASKPSATAGATQGGLTRYLAGRATWRTAATTIANATGHQCSPRPAAPSGVTGGGSAGFRPDAIPQCGTGFWRLGNTAVGEA
jgi:hypothetical protein